MRQEPPSHHRKQVILIFLAHRVIEWVDFSNKKGSRPHGNWL